jgi:hypothetical protein
MSGSETSRGAARSFLLSAALALAFVLLWPDGALAETFTVTNVKDSGRGSLRQAILNANARMGADTIRFRIDGRGVKTIRPKSPLPVITTDGLTIDGYTQRGAKRNTLASGTNAKLKIQLDGTNVQGGFAALVVGPGADGSRVSGLIINRFDNSGISIEAGGCSVAGNFIGTNASGDADLGNGDIGVNVGVNADSNTIGGEFLNARNLISGNEGHGVRIDGNSAENNAVWSNLIGTNAAGNAALGNAGTGVALLDGSSGNLIGGRFEGARNVISGNGDDGVLIEASDNVVQGNFIGTDATGNTDLGNTENGISVQGGGGHVIGGPSSGAGNVISGNSEDGITLSSSNNTVQGNFVGTDSRNFADLGNAGEGITMDAGASSNTIGGLPALARNVVSGNGSNGVVINGPSNVVQGNLIDDNAFAGVLVQADSNVVGGSLPSAGNTISGNGDDGVTVIGVRNSILFNSIVANTGLGIDLGGDGVTANDGDNPLTPVVVETDNDTGPNNLQNFPEVRSASASGTTLTIAGSLESAPRQTFTVQCYLADNPVDPSGHGEGQTLVEETTITTGANGEASFTCSSGSQGLISAGRRVTATATNVTTGDTSEFADNVTVRTG